MVATAVTVVMAARLEHQLKQLLSQEADVAEMVVMAAGEVTIRLVGPAMAEMEVTVATAVPALVAVAVETEETAEVVVMEIHPVKEAKKERTEKAEEVTHRIKMAGMVVPVRPVIQASF